MKHEVRVTLFIDGDAEFVKTLTPAEKLTRKSLSLLIAELERVKSELVERLGNTENLLEVVE